MSAVARGLARFALGALLALVAAELVARRFQLAPREIDPVFGAVYACGATVRWGTEGDAVGHWNARGVRAPGVPDPGRPVILVLGDSFTEAAQVGDDEVYTRRLEQRLAERGLPHAVLNAGKAGASAPHYLALAGAYRETFRPAHVIVQLKDNDLGSDAFERPDVRIHRRDDGGFDVALRQARSGFWSERVLRPLGRTFALPYFFQARLGEHRSAWAAEPPLFAAAAAPALRTGAADAEPIDRHPVGDLLDAVHAAYDGDLTFFYVPPFDPDHPADPASRTEIFVAEHCRERGWSCTSLRRTFPDFAKRHEAPYGFPNTLWNWGHLNAAGHAAAGDVLAEEITRLAERDLL